MLIYPAIDLLDGKCVRLRRGDFAWQTIYSDVPAEQARRFLEGGFKIIHIVDLDGAREGRIINWEALQGILNVPDVQAHFGGGIRTREDVKSLLDAGVTRVIIGSLALQSPHIVQEWIREFTGDRIIVAVDVHKGTIAYKGWLEQANLTPSAFVNSMEQAGAVHFLCTDTERDGTLEGPNLELYASLRTEFPHLQFIAAGGVSRREDIDQLKTTGCAGVVLGKALYEGRISIEELAGYAGS